MENLNFINLIQAGIIASSLLGGSLLWLTKSKEFRGIAVLLFLIAFASSINILEESGLTRDWYLISPVFIMLFGPATYLAVKLLLDKKLAPIQWWHLFPVIPILMFTSYLHAVIAIGTVWRVSYAFITALLLFQYKRILDEERSDSDDFSLSWLIWLLTITALFNLIDLVRLNIQQSIPYELNLFGQGLNNTVWLVTVMVIIIKLQMQKAMPKKIEPIEINQNNQHNTKEVQEDYRSIFTEIDTLFTQNQWFLKPRLTLNEISNLTGLQTRDISRAINLVNDKSFNEYVNDYRVEFVCTTLKADPTKSLSDIAADAGFSSKASFNKVFKQTTGLTPTEYKLR